jgi:hypothetical protein
MKFFKLYSKDLKLLTITIIFVHNQDGSLSNSLEELAQLTAQSSAGSFPFVPCFGL